jgi:hypothetical protein
MLKLKRLKDQEEKEEEGDGKYIKCSKRIGKK